MVIFYEDHCINAIRESLMCSADVTPNVWKWNEFKRIAQVQFNNVHTCVDWDALKDWAKANRAPVKFADAIHTHGELVPADYDDEDKGAKMGHEHEHHNHPTM